MKVLVKTKNLSHTDWLRYRTMGIGGSDVSVIAGINPYRSVYQLWLEKTGQNEPAESENEYTHFGTILEPVIRREFMERTGLKVRQKHMLLQSEECPFMLANLDGVINLDGKMCIFEAKTASAYKLDDWQSGIPPEYMLQVQHYMAVTGAVKTYIAALIGGNHFEYKLIERDDDMIVKIIAMEKLFWEVNVLGGIAPKIDGTKATTEFFNCKYNYSNGQTVELPEEIVVSHPCSLQYHKTEFPWADVMKKAVSMYYRSHNTNTCGLHIHIGREDLGETVEEQEEVISRIMFFFESHWNEMFNFSRRSEYAVEHWASRYGYKDKPKDILEDAKKNRKGRYACVNITNYSTIEIRLFRGTLKYNTFIAALEMVDLICENAIKLSDAAIQKQSWNEFVIMIPESYQELIRYLKERRLYVNEPVINEEEI